MGKKTKLYGGALALCAALAALAPGGAAAAARDGAESAAAREAAPSPPMVFEGDDISYDEATGAVYAKGNVRIMRQTAAVTADEMRGNTQTEEVWIDGRAHITQQERPSLDLSGDETHYRYGAREGTMRRIEGRADERYVKGERLEFYPEEIVIYNGTMTKCPAKKPDYHMSARKIEVWPDDRLVAHDAKFWIRDVLIYSTARYETKIGKNAENHAFPQVGYNTDDGAFIKQRFEHPLTEEIAAYIDLGYYSKHDFKNDYGVILRRPNYSFTVAAGDYQDDDDFWIKKEPNFHFSYPRQQIGDLPFFYRFDAEYGKWSDDRKTSWHQDYELYLSHAPIALTDSLKLHLGAGYEMIRESYDSSGINTMKYDATLHQQFSPRLSAWTGYHYTKNNAFNSLFNYDTPDVGKELASGVYYRFDAKNAVSVSQSYDLENSRTADMYYTWYRNLHCWEMQLTYQRDYLNKDRKLKWKINVAHW